MSNPIQAILLSILKYKTLKTPDLVIKGLRHV